MSRSRRKTPIRDITTARSERVDKTRWHKLWRTRERNSLAAATPDLDTYLPLAERQVVNVWDMSKDGRRYRSEEEQVAQAEWHANRVGRTARERESLKVRRLRRWVAK